VDLSRLTDWIQLKPRYLLPLFAASSVLLFAPAPLNATLGITGLIENYRGWIGVVWLVTGSLLLTHLTIALWEVAKKWIKGRRRAKTYHESITGLSPQEKEVLVRFVDDQRSTVVLKMGEGVAETLVSKGILFRASTISQGLDYFAYSLQPWAWEYLNENPELLEAGRSDSD
jgi:hypothetical protein